MKKLFNIAFVATALTVSQSPVLAQAPTNPLYAYSSDGKRGPLLEPEKHAIQIYTPSGNMLLVENDVYAIEYFSQDQTFSISIVGRNLQAARRAAERDFLNRFQITRDQACNLKVTVGTMHSVSPKYAGRELGLSFCRGSIKLPG